MAADYAVSIITALGAPHNVVYLIVLYASLEVMIPSMRMSSN